MTRPTRYKLGYIVALIALGALVVAVWAASGWNRAVLLGAAVVLLIPGRVQGHLFRDLFTGRRALAEGRYDASVRHTEGFLTMIRARPSLKPLVWLAWTFYTPDVEAMALGNLGAAHLEAGRLGEAERALRGALKVDPDYPIPYHNLAILAEAAGDRTEAERLAAEARRLGYAPSTSDHVIAQGSTLLARAEGRGERPASGTEPGTGSGRDPE